MTFRITILPNKTSTSTLRRASTLRRTEIRKTHMKGITHSEPASLAKTPNALVFNRKIRETTIYRQGKSTQKECKRLQ